MLYLENAETQKKGKRNGRKNVTVFSMAMANLTSNHKRTIGTILTMGFSCVLFVIISNYVGNIDTEHEARLSVNQDVYKRQVLTLGTYLNILYLNGGVLYGNN